MFGVPKTDVERLMSHYGISEEEAVELLTSYPVDLLLPQRGSGLAPVEIIGSSREDLASGLMVMEGSINTGEKARITFCTEALPSDMDMAAMYLDMVAMGCHVSYPTARVAGGVPTTEFVLEKGSPAWPLIIPLIIPLFTVGLVAFGITKIESITKALVPIILISLGGIIVLAAVLSKPATKYIERGGKVPYLPSTKKDIKDRQLDRWEKELGVKSAKYNGKYILSIERGPNKGTITWYEDGGDAIKMAEKIFKESGFHVKVQDRDSGNIFYKTGKYYWEQEGWGKDAKGYRLDKFPEEYYQVKDVEDIKRLLFMAVDRNDNIAWKKVQEYPDLLKKVASDEPEEQYPDYKSRARKALKKALAVR